MIKVKKTHMRESFKKYYINKRRKENNKKPSASFEEILRKSCDEINERNT